MDKFPKFDSDEDAAAWFDSHDTAVFIDPLQAEKMNFYVVRTQFPTRPIDVRLRTDFYTTD